MITTIRKGYKIISMGIIYRVIGSRNIRGKYFYVVRREFDDVKFSINREKIIAGQKLGSITITA